MVNFSGILIVLLSLVVTFVIVHIVRAQNLFHAEISRKILHIFSGMATLIFPLVFIGNSEVILLAAISFISIFYIKKSRLLKNGLGRVMKCETRYSLGDYYFPLSVLILWVFTGENRLFFIIPVLVLTFADSAAALTGTFIGKIKLRIFNSKKTLEGSMACFFTTYFITFWILANSLNGIKTLIFIILLSGFIAILTTIIELISYGGFDNITIPLSILILLKSSDYLSTNILVVLNILTVLAVIAVTFMVFKRKIKTV